MSLSFFPALGWPPVKPNVRVSVMMKNGEFKEGYASDFDWHDQRKKTGIEGWRKMGENEILHQQHRPNQEVSNGE